MKQILMALALVVSPCSAFAQSVVLDENVGGFPEVAHFVDAATSATSFLPPSVDRAAYTALVRNTRVVSVTSSRVRDLGMSITRSRIAADPLAAVSGERIYISHQRVRDLFRSSRSVGAILSEFGINFNLARYSNEVRRLPSLQREDCLAVLAAHAYLQLLGYSGDRLDQAILSLLQARASSRIGGDSGSSATPDSAGSL